MTIEISYLAAANQQSSRWSGGSTTELAIFPPGASYAAHDFAWRISTASVDATESTFTALPGFQRQLMVLEGKMHLNHQGHHHVTLHPLEQDRFCGSWITHCQGKGRDYNLMLAEGWRGELRPLFLTGSASQQLALAAGLTAAFYCFAGELTMALPGQSMWQLSVSDFLSLTVSDHETEIEVSFWTESAATVITAMIERQNDRG